MNRRYDILDGHLYAPTQLIKLVNHPVFERLFESLWHNYLMHGPSTTSATYWFDEFNDSKAFNRALYHLSKSGWVIATSIPSRNWGTIALDPAKLLKWVTKDELLQVRQTFKFSKYRLQNNESTWNNKTKTPKGVKDTGLTRSGIMKSGNNKFKYDTTYLEKYYNAIVLNTTKSMELIIQKHDIVVDGADYKTIATEIIDSHLYSPQEEFTLGNSLIDSRGRAISTSLSKVFAPIGNKDARALLIGPMGSLAKENYIQIYLFIAELLGDKAKDLKGKALLGKMAYTERKLHDLDLSKESDRADLYENIWLERIYDALDNYDGSNWCVPIELDATASVIQIEGALLGDYNMLDETNVLNQDDLKDVWSKGMPRKQFKFGATPLLYGSTQPCTKLWKKRKVKYTKEHIKLFNKEIKGGVLGLADAFKDYIIDNVEPQPEMLVNIMGEEFTVYCNKYMNVGDYVKKYPLYDTASDSVLNVNHTHTNRVPDLEAFKRYMVTLLCHNRDSWIADEVCLEIEWILPIYDAFIVMPWEALETRIIYGDKIGLIEAQREETLEVYFKSVNLVKTVGSEKQWKAIQKRIKPIENFKCKITALK